MSNAPALPDLESAMNEACLMAGIAADRLEDMFSRSAAYDPRRPELWRFAPHEIERTLFAVDQAQRMMEDLKAAYMAAAYPAG